MSFMLYFYNLLNIGARVFDPYISRIPGTRPGPGILRIHPSGCRRYLLEASINFLKMGCALSGLDLNSGWYWTPR